MLFQNQKGFEPKQDMNCSNPSSVSGQESSIMKVSSGSLPKEAGLLAEYLNLIYCFAGVGDF